MAYTTVKALFTAICDAIREKTGKNGIINHEDIPEEIESIQTGVTPTGTVEIELNGVHNVAAFAEANVFVQGGKSSYADPEVPAGYTAFECTSNYLPTQADLYRIKTGAKYERRCLPTTAPATGTLAAITGAISGTEAERFVVYGKVAYARTYSNYMQLRLTVEGVLLGGDPDAELVLTACGTGLDVRGRNAVTVTPHLYDTAIEENGKYEVPEGYDGYGSITVDVSGGGGDISELVTGMIMEVKDYAEKIDTVKDFAFAFCPDLHTVDLPAAVTLGKGAFAGSGAVDTTDYELPDIETIPEAAFEGASGTHVYAQSAQEIEADAFTGATITHIRTPALETLGSPAFSSAAIVSIDLGKLPSIAMNAFENVAPLRLVALRKTGSPAPLVSIDAFTGTEIGNGRGYVLVPTALVSMYKTATYWSGLYSRGTQFLPLEQYTYDGTVTDELNEGLIEQLLG